MRKVALIFFVILGLTSSAFAHKISSFVDVEDGKVNVMTYFNDGTPCKNSKVEVFDLKTGKLILTGKTNENGEFSFTPKVKDDIKVVVEAELGHKTETVVKASEFSENNEDAASSETEENTSPETTETTNTGATPAPSIDKEELKKLVKETVKEELKPIRQELLKIQMALTKPTFSEIFGGIGWIIGLFGIGAFVYSRKENNGK